MSTTNNSNTGNSNSRTTSLQLPSASWRQRLAERQQRNTPAPANESKSQSQSQKNTANRNRTPFSSLLSANRSRTTQEASLTAKLRHSTATTTTTNNNNLSDASRIAPSNAVATTPVTPTNHEAVQASSSLDVGADLVEFGASVEFHDDHRRHIHAETLQIEASNQTTEASIAKETTLEAQLRKDLGRARSELSTLQQGAHDQWETATMFGTLLQNLKGELESSMVEPTKPSRPTPTLTPAATDRSAAGCQPVTPEARLQSPHSREDNENDSDNHSAKMTPSKSERPPASTQEILAEKASRMNALLRELQDGKQSLQAAVEDIRDLHEKQARLEESMAFQGLDNVLERAKEDERRLQSELQQENDAVETRRVEIQQIRDSCGTKAQKCTDLAKELAQAKKSHQIEETNLREELQTIQAETSDLRTKEEETMLQVELENRKLEKMKKEMEDYRYYCKARKDYKTQAAIRAEKKRELEARKATADGKLQQARQEEEASLLRKQQAQKSMDAAQAQRAKNSEVETNVILPGKAELAKLNQRKLELAKLIAESSKAAEKERTQHREALARKEQAKKEAIAQVQQVQAEWKAKQEEMEATIQKHQDFLRSHHEEIASHQAQAQTFVDLQASERQAYDQRLQAGRERWKANLSRDAQDHEDILEANDFRAEVLERGARMLQETKQVEQEAEAM